MRTWCFNFKQQFAADVKSGKKHQTIRALRKDGRLPEIGDIAKCYTGLRTKQTKLLRTSEVVEVALVHMAFSAHIVAINHQTLDPRAASAFAIADGFASVNDMLSWFKQQYGGDYFRGYLTVWPRSVAVHSI